jgi:hypothetical protein
VDREKITRVNRVTSGPADDLSDTFTDASQLIGAYRVMEPCRGHPEWP